MAAKRFSVQKGFTAQLKKAARDLNKIERGLSLEIGIAMEEMGRDIITLSNSLCPYETGKLRNSAKAWVRKAGGEEFLAYRITGASSGGGGSAEHQQPVSGYSTRWDLIVTYDRFDDKKGTFDVALYCHESMEYTPRKPNTGPKFLAIAGQQLEGLFHDRLSSKARKALSQYSAGTVWKMRM